MFKQKCVAIIEHPQSTRLSWITRDKKLAYQIKNKNHLRYLQRKISTTFNLREP